MSHAWLDSLSEDWPSQPGSDASPPAQLPRLSDHENSDPSQAKGHSSRIPLPIGKPQRAAPSINDSSIQILSERSTNEKIIPSSARKASKLSQELKAEQGSRYASQTFSASTAGSVVHNTVQHKSWNSSHANGHGQTPEWRRRLVYGDVAYGEQRDLFCSAATGLENMFKPPPAPDSESPQHPSHDMTMPSSPPVHHMDAPETPQYYDEDDEDERSLARAHEGSPSPSPRRPREMTYKLNESIDQSDLANATHQSDDQSHEEMGDQSLPPRATTLLPPHDDSRKTSGQSVVRNEDFSPILLSCRKGANGNVGFAPELAPDQLKNRLEKLRINQMLLDSYAEGDLDFSDLQEDGASGRVEDTDDFAKQGGFLNLQRGGRSGEGSFRHRPLSPGLGVDTSEMLPEESLQASTPKQFPSVRVHDLSSQRYASTSPPALRAPFPSPEKAGATSQTSGGSPLKLFGVYDTFTNQTLLRRISQFEDGSSDSSRVMSSNIHVPNTQVETPVSPTSPARRSVSQFGRGDLEGYRFEENLSLRYDSEPEDGEDEQPEFSPARSSPNIRLRPGNESPDDHGQMFMRKSRQQSGMSTHPRYLRAVSFSSDGDAHRMGPSKPGDNVKTTPKRDSGSEGKRQRTSPSKDPTPKRRRTLHESDTDFRREPQPATIEAVQDTHFSMQSMMTRKRKEARPGAPLEPANPAIMALRDVLRPRSPTPSQRSSVQREHIPSWGSLPDQQSQRRSPKKTPHLEISNNDRSQSTETDRKPSIRTQDFVDQAGAIMAMIRNGSKPPSGLASVEESDEENKDESQAAEDESYDESTKEPFSRPPSRDGAPVPRVPVRQEDPKILDHLRKYQELSDMGEVISSSLRSLGEARELMEAVQGVERQLHDESGDGPYPDHLDDLLSDDVVSDPPNIRISHGPARNQADNRDEYPSQTSVGSMAESVPTGSSRGSDSRRIIAPQSVSHLIPDQVGSMYLDRQQNIWIKRKGGRRSLNVLPSEDSEDDPFASIPDLSVDLTREMNNLRLLGAQRESADAESSEQSMSDMSQTPSSQQSRSYVVLSPDAAVPEEISVRAQEEITKLKTKQGRDTGKQDLEEEMRVEDRITKDTPSRRNLTISFSSPIASIIHDMSMEDLDSLEDDTGRYPQAQPGSGPAPSMKNKYASLTKAARQKLQHRSRNVSRGPNRQLSLRGQAFVPRPVSRIDEHEEESQNGNTDPDNRQISIIGETSVVNHVPENQQTSLSFVLSTPRVRDEAGGAISKNVGNMSLTPLSDFTMHQQDQSFGLEVSYIVDERHLVTGDGSKRVLSMAVRELVDRLTEVEPFEPNWEDFHELDVSGKRLTSLHMLDEFCGRLVTLDASQNSLNHLDGIPTSVRQLKITQNSLTGLTSWDHLLNLQYIDVSDNGLESLAALSGLVHLRSVKADNNRLTSLDGLRFHDGLLSLRARDNQIEALDFEDNKMDRLVELDLAGNKIKEVRHLGDLGSLEVLKLQRNELEAFCPEVHLQNLRYLDLGDNDVADFDISYMPALRLLHADRNRISKITGFVRARHLDSVSLREQRCEAQLDLSFLSAAYEIRKLFLSGNYLGTFEPKVDFLNLQLLELANCGLHELPENLGQLMPNLRSLNLNYNAISSVSAIRYIPRLKKLLMAGNRLSDSTHATEVLTEFPHLTRLDLRDNPMTLGFYPPLQALVPVDRTGYVDPFVLPEADAERDRLFAGRLDEATRLRRRLYQMVFVGCCKRLRVLDGLSVDRKAVLARDAAFDKLLGAGIFPGDDGGQQQQQQQQQAQEPEGQAAEACDESSRWNAEDSFA